MDVYAFAKRLLESNPDKASTPLGQELSKLLESRDATRGEQIANNILNTYGLTKEEALKKKDILGL